MGRIISAECYPRLAELVDNAALPLDEAVRVRVRAGASISPSNYAEVLSERERAKREFATRIEGIDAVLTPAAMTPPIPVAEVDQRTTPALSTRWVNFLDLCALALPNGMTSHALPTSSADLPAAAAPKRWRCGSAGRWKTPPSGRRWRRWFRIRLKRDLVAA